MDVPNNGFHQGWRGGKGMSKASRHKISPKFGQVTLQRQPRLPQSMGLGSCSPGWIEALEGFSCTLFPSASVLSLVLITPVAVAAWLGASSWEPAELGDFFVLGRASPPAGLQIPLVFWERSWAVPGSILHLPMLSQV